MWRIVAALSCIGCAAAPTVPGAASSPATAEHQRSSADDHEEELQKLFIDGGALVDAKAYAPDG